MFHSNLTSQPHDPQHQQLIVAPEDNMSRFLSAVHLLSTSPRVPQDFQLLQHSQREGNKWSDQRGPSSFSYSQYGNAAPLVVDGCNYRSYQQQQQEQREGIELECEEEEDDGFIEGKKSSVAAAARTLHHATASLHKYLKDHMIPAPKFYTIPASCLRHLFRWAFQSKQYSPTPSPLLLGPPAESSVCYNISPDDEDGWERNNKGHHAYRRRLFDSSSSREKEYYEGNHFRRRRLEAHVPIRSDRIEELDDYGRSLRKRDRGSQSTLEHDAYLDECYQHLKPEEKKEQEGLHSNTAVDASYTMVGSRKRSMRTYTEYDRQEEEEDLPIMKSRRFEAKTNETASASAGTISTNNGTCPSSHRCINTTALSRTAVLASSPLSTELIPNSKSSSSSPAPKTKNEKGSWNSQEEALPLAPNNNNNNNGSHRRRHHGIFSRIGTSISNFVSNVFSTSAKSGAKGGETERNKNERKKRLREEIEEEEERERGGANSAYCNEETNAASGSRQCFSSSSSYAAEVGPTFPIKGQQIPMVSASACS